MKRRATRAKQRAMRIPSWPFDLDLERAASSEQGRRGWLRDARRQLDERRKSEARPIARSRAERLREAKRRLGQELTAERAAHAAYESYRARGVMKDGRRFGRPPDPHTPPQTPTGTINTTDHDSRIVRTQGQPAKQGYNAQLAVNEHQIIVAAEITVDSPDFGHLEPMSTRPPASSSRLVSLRHPKRSSPILVTGTKSRSRTSLVAASRC